MEKNKYLKLKMNQRLFVGYFYLIENLMQIEIIAYSSYNDQNISRDMKDVTRFKLKY